MLNRLNSRVPIEPAMDWLGRLFEMMPMRAGRSALLLRRAMAHQSGTEGPLGDAVAGLRVSAG